MKKDMIKPLVWGVVIGGILMLIFVFATGWVTKSSTAQEETQQAVEEAMIDSLAPICVEQFKRDVNKETSLKELKGMNSWVRYEYIQKQGWATMPGSENSNAGVARECAQRIVDLQ